MQCFLGWEKNHEQALLPGWLYRRGRCDRGVRPHLPIYQLPVPQISDGPFSAVSKPNFATKYSFCSIFRDLQDSQTVAPLQIPNLQNFCNCLQFFGQFSRFCKILLKFAKIDYFSPRFSRNFTGIARNPR